MAVKKSGDAGRIQADAARAALEEAGQDPAPVADILADLAHPERILAWRDHTGAPSAARVQAQVQSLKAQVAAHAKGFADRQARLTAAWERCKTLKA